MSSLFFTLLVKKLETQLIFENASNNLDVMSRSRDLGSRDLSTHPNIKLKSYIPQPQLFSPSV